MVFGGRGLSGSQGRTHQEKRVNRVFQDKPGGLVVDYLGLAHELKQALATYTRSGGTGRTAIDQAEAVAAMLEKYEICCPLHKSTSSPRKTGRIASRGPSVSFPRPSPWRCPMRKH